MKFKISNVPDGRKSEDANLEVEEYGEFVE